MWKYLVSVFIITLVTTWCGAGQSIQTNQSSSQNAKPFTIATADGKTEITIDPSQAPELTDWTEHKLAPVLAGWYPKIVSLLPSSNYTAPTAIHVIIRPMDGVAYTTGTEINVSAQWCAAQMNGEAIGSVVHELVHVVQHYGDARVPGWLVEGMADYIRWFQYEPQSHGADMDWLRKHGKNFTPRYDAGYRQSANFLDWLATRYGPAIIPAVNAAAREGKYTDDFWKQYTGKTLAELGGEWKQEIETQLRSPETGNAPAK